jgi:hypothetical protein
MRRSVNDSVDVMQISTRSHKTGPALELTGQFIDFGPRGLLKRRSCWKLLKELFQEEFRFRFGIMFLWWWYVISRLGWS